MILEEAIERYIYNAEYERTHGNLQGCLEFRQLAEWLKDYKRLLEQEPILDKIRVEIESQRKEVSNKHYEDYELTNYYFGLNDGLKDARDIIDKYKEENEDKE